MLKTRILTAIVLGCSLLAGLFLLPPIWAAAAFGAVFTFGAWEWSGFGGLSGGGARGAYAAAVALLLLLAWKWTDDPRHLLLLLRLACRVVADRAVLARRSRRPGIIGRSRCFAGCRCWCRPSSPWRGCWSPLAALRAARKSCCGWCCW